MSGFTLPELLVVIGLIALLITIIVPLAGRIRRSSNEVNCLSNLRQLAIGFVAYAAQNRGLFPDPQISQAPWETMLQETLPQPNLFRCPADDELFPTIGSSYDWRDTGNPRTTLAGHAVTTAPPTAVLVFDSLPGWHAKRKMNAALADGSAQVMSDRDCLENLSRPLDELLKLTKAGGK